MKIVPQLNHDLFSFTKSMKEGWLMNGRWKEGGLMIELFKQTKPSMKFDRMIPSGSSWLMGIKTQRLEGQAHAAIEPGKSIPIWKFHQITGNWCIHLVFFVFHLLAMNLGVPGVIDNLSFIALLPNFCSQLLIIEGFPSHPLVFSLFMWNSQPK